MWPSTRNANGASTTPAAWPAWRPRPEAPANRPRHVSRVEPPGRQRPHGSRRVHGMQRFHCVRRPHGMRRPHAVGQPHQPNQNGRSKPLAARASTAERKRTTKGLQAHEGAPTTQKKERTPTRPHTKHEGLCMTAILCQWTQGPDNTSLAGVRSTRFGFGRTSVPSDMARPNSEVRNRSGKAWHRRLLTSAPARQMVPLAPLCGPNRAGKMECCPNPSRERPFWGRDPE